MSLSLACVLIESPGTPVVHSIFSSPVGPEREREPPLSLRLFTVSDFHPAGHVKSPRSLRKERAEKKLGLRERKVHQHLFGSSLRGRTKSLNTCAFPHV